MQGQTPSSTLFPFTGAQGALCSMGTGFCGLWRRLTARQLFLKTPCGPAAPALLMPLPAELRTTLLPGAENT